MTFEGEVSEPITEEKYSDLEYNVNPWLRKYVKTAVRIGLRSVKRPGTVDVGDKKVEAICRNCRYWGTEILIDEHLFLQRGEKSKESDPTVRICRKFDIGTLWSKVCDHFTP